jgi:hypothetical protein
MICTEQLPLPFSGPPVRDDIKRRIHELLTDLNSA